MKPEIYNRPLAQKKKKRQRIVTSYKFAIFQARKHQHEDVLYLHPDLLIHLHHEIRIEQFSSVRNQYEIKEKQLYILTKPKITC